MKRLISIISCIAVYGILLAQIIPNKQEKEPVVRLPVSKWVIVLKGVSELPLKESQDVYMSIVTQINSQMQDSTKKK